MHRAILEACFPWFAAWLIAAGLIVLLIQTCGARWQAGRWRQLHRCEKGAVQSLSLVLTLPVFTLLVLFIVQVSQVMTAVAIVHYSAFAAARAASVWIPSDVTTMDPTFFDDLSAYDVVNDQLKGPPERANVISASVMTSPSDAHTFRVLGNANNLSASLKLQKISQAAILACAPLAPSGSSSAASQAAPQWLQQAIRTTQTVYSRIDPVSRSNGRIASRIQNKYVYSWQNTFVMLEWTEVLHGHRDVEYGPTYNPRYHPAPYVPPWNPNEVGFRDPVTVWVQHRYALLPGIGRILSYYLVTPQMPVDRVSPRVKRVTDSAGNQLYTIDLVASATFVNEGYKSVLRYAQQP